MLTNAGALLADESPVYCSRLFCTRWNGMDKASGVIEALDDEEYIGNLIFEGLVNGLMHRDYLDMGSEVHIDNVPSKRRNPVVADVFSRLDYMERRGSGFKKIMQAYEAEPNYTKDKKPVFYSNTTEFRVILKNHNFTNEVLNSERIEKEIKVIKTILLSPRIKQKELAEQMGRSVSTIQRIIKAQIV